VKRVQGASVVPSARTAGGDALPPARPLGTLLLPRVTCPRCQARPRLRVTPALAGACIGLPPGELLLTHRCRCGEVFALTAGAFTGAWDLRR